MNAKSCVTIASVLVGHALAQPCTNSVSGLAIDDRLGWSMAVIGDVDLDGIVDYAVGAPQASNIENLSGQRGNGYVLMISGRTGTTLRTVLGPSALAQFGHSIAGLCDRDGDGLPDAGHGDVDGDGVPDFAVGAPAATVSGKSNAGTCYIVSGKSGAIVRTFDFPTGYTNGKLGWALSSAGDQTGDGKPELLVGMPGYSVLGSGGRGQAFLLDVATVPVTVLATMPGTASNEGIGFSCAFCKDIDGDNKPDLLVGSTNLNQVRILKSSALPGISYTTIQDFAVGFGYRITSVGDLDGDGKGDFAVAAHECVAGTSCLTPGRVIVYSGATRSTLLTLQGRRAGDEFGSSLAVSPDLDGDGKPDMLIGARSSDPLGTASSLADAGEARIYGSKTGQELAELIGSAKDALGASVIGIGDVTGDGNPDFVVGSIDASASIATPQCGKVTRFLATGQAMRIGRGCPTSYGQPPVIHEGGDGPCIGTANYRIYASRVPSTGPAVLVLGDSNTSWGALSLPIVNFLRAGCDLNVSALVQLVVTQSGQFSAWGQAEAALPIPNQTSLRGVVLYLQFVVSDFQLSNPAPYIAMTQGMRVVLR